MIIHESMKRLNSETKLKPVVLKHIFTIIFPAKLLNRFKVEIKMNFLLKI